MGCDCGKSKCDGHCGVSPAVLQINNPSECVFFHRVEVPASMGDSKTNPPKTGAYKNTLLYYIADGEAYFYSSDGIPTRLTDAAAFRELKEYVDTYFDNLDVQEEINNKLDQMTEDGTLQEIIAAYIQANVAWTFDTVADMQSATNLVDGSHAQTYGFYELSDGGGAKYKIRELTLDDTIDGMFLLALNDPTLVAELVIDKILYSKQCGLIGDGETDETTKLNTFFGYSSPVNKVLNEGLYVASSTVYIKGTWRQQTGINAQPKITFEKASILYTGSDDTCSMLIYGMFKYRLENISIAENSSPSYIKFAGCWSCEIDNCTFPKVKLEVTTDDMTGLSYPTLSIEYLRFVNCYFQGTLTINPGTTTYFLNVLTFDNCWIHGNQNPYCVVFPGNKQCENITFNNCDISYPTEAVFYVMQEQTGRGYVNCNNCYFDSNKNMYKDFNQNKMQFNFFQCMLAAQSNQEMYNLSVTDTMKNFAVGGMGGHAFNLPMGCVNYTKNGNMESSSTIRGGHNLMGASTASLTKEWIEANKNINGRGRKLTSLMHEGDGNLNQYVPAGCNAPYAGEYLAFVRLKVTAYDTTDYKALSGDNANIQTSFAGKSAKWYLKDIANKDVILINSKNNISHGLAEDASLQFSITVVHPENFVAEIYEVGVLPGRIYTPNAPLHSTAKIES